MGNDPCCSEKKPKYVNDLPKEERHKPRTGSKNNILKTKWAVDSKDNIRDGSLVFEEKYESRIETAGTSDPWKMTLQQLNANRNSNNQLAEQLNNSKHKNYYTAVTSDIYMVHGEAEPGTK